MATIVHHRPAHPALTYRLHAWDRTSTWDLDGTADGEGLDFVLPEVADTRNLEFLFRTVDPQHDGRLTVRPGSRRLGA